MWRWRREGWAGVALLVLLLVALAYSVPWPRPGWRWHDWQRRSQWGIPVVWRLAQGDRLVGLGLVTSASQGVVPAPAMLLVAVYTPRMRFLDLLLLPSETEVQMPSTPAEPLRIDRDPPFQSLGALYTEEYQTSQGDLRAASERLCRAIEGLLSSEQRGIHIDYLFQLREEGVCTLVDVFGGVPLAEQDGRKSGNGRPHRFTGTQSLEFLHAAAGAKSQELGWRQQIFVKQCLQRLQDPRWLLRLIRGWPVVRRGGATNTTPWDLAHLMLELQRVKVSNVRFFQLPGRWKGGGWYPDPALIPQTTEALFGVGPAPLVTPRQLPIGEVPIHRQAATVEVWNASPQERLAYDVTLRLRSYGFDVVTYGNYSTRQHRTLVIDRTGNIWTAHTVARLLQASDAEVVTRVDPARLVDVSVILGDGYPSER